MFDFDFLIYLFFVKNRNIPFKVQPNFFVQSAQSRFANFGGFPT